MGYRNYLCRIKKEGLIEGKEYFDYDNEIENLHELGKYVDSEISDGLIVLKDLDDEETEFKIIDIESIPHIVSHYAKKTLKFLESVDKGENQIFDAEKMLKDAILEWNHPETFIYNIDKKDDSIVRSWSYQYAIFDLIRIYKSFDTEKYYLLWTGH
jgi:hypothetical protein